MALEAKYEIDKLTISLELTLSSSLLKSERIYLYTESKEREIDNDNLENVQILEILRIYRIY